MIIPAHSSHLIQDFLTKHSIVQLHQSPYSPDVASCNFYDNRLLFPFTNKMALLKPAAQPAGENREEDPLSRWKEQERKSARDTHLSRRMLAPEVSAYVLGRRG
ncbi:hypothetical protein ALC60_03599 [Trachymyrmex zeteki]|uniref:Histone-lysine N-methyltransferase SETMAR n=1 Tax=Mycetomoellerius zeteki TaxID=64791 RepID=A0A151XBA8_9HYME|nr:hypothetical protein ALC60_03599 [Trachymyrmex zeteki]